MFSELRLFVLALVVAITFLLSNFSLDIGTRTGSGFRMPVVRASAVEGEDDADEDGEDEDEEEDEERELEEEIEEAEERLEEIKEELKVLQKEREILK